MELLLIEVIQVVLVVVLVQHREDLAVEQDQQEAIMQWEVVDIPAV
jgi:hypothetical protein